MLLTSYIQSLFPKVLGKVIDILKEKGFDPHLVINCIYYILLIAAGTFVTTYIWRNLVIANARNLECHLREMLHDHFQKLSPEFYSKRKTGDLIAYAINDISAVRMTFGPASAMAINGAVICCVSIYSMVGEAGLKLTLFSLVPIPLIIFIMLKMGRIIRKRFKKVQENFASISDRVQENINGIRVIKAYVQEEDEVEKFEKLNSRMVDSNLSMVRVSSLLSPVIELSFSISFVLNLIIGGNMVLNGTVTLGSFAAFNGYLVMIMAPIISIGRVINIFQRGMASLKRLEEIFSVSPAIIDGEKMVEKPVEGGIRVVNLSFTYPGAGEAALSNINFELKKGCTLGIIGRTGSGKSTLTSLLLKLYNFLFSNFLRISLNF
jgi:ATP-binding cassette subfamily B protein